MVKLKNCLVCGKEFKPCATCNRNTPEELQWRRVVCCPAHFQYHLPIIKYVRKEITKAEAKELLQTAIDTYGKIEFYNNVKAVAEEILADDNVENIADNPAVTKTNLSKTKK